jgi:hypothetical protein
MVHPVSRKLIIKMGGMINRIAVKLNIRMMIKYGEKRELGSR